MEYFPPPGIGIEIRMDPHYFELLDPDLDPGKKLPTKLKKEFSCVGCLRAEGFFCSLGVLCRGLEISKLQFLIKK
jgi:hypothetical protein